MAFVFADRVKETSLTNGTSTFVLGGALTGFQRFSAVCGINDRLYYSAHTVDASGAPNGAWECGVGVYSAANTITRAVVLASSNGGAAVNFASSTKHVFIAVPAKAFANFAEVALTSVNLYVRGDGSDANDGRANTSARAFLTIQRALDEVPSIQKASGLYINIADGTYDWALVAPKPLAYSVGLVGNTTTPANVAIAVSGGDAAFDVTSGGRYALSGLTISSEGDGVFARGSDASVSLSRVNFGTCGGAHIRASDQASIYSDTACTISGGATSHYALDLQARLIQYAVATTLSGTPAFSEAFVSMTEGSILRVDGTFSGSATGKRYDVRGCSFLNSNGVTFPGSVAGTTATGGQVA